jgi:hypothetical protein
VKNAHSAFAWHSRWQLGQLVIAETCTIVSDALVATRRIVSNMTHDVSG